MTSMTVPWESAASEALFITAMTGGDDQQTTTVQVAVTGVGPAGVAMAVSLRDRGLRARC